MPQKTLTFGISGRSRCVDQGGTLVDSHVSMTFLDWLVVLVTVTQFHQLLPANDVLEVRRSARVLDNLFEVWQFVPNIPNFLSHPGIFNHQDIGRAIIQNELIRVHIVRRIQSNCLKVKLEFKFQI